MKLTFYGGVNEIGGNKILLEHKKTRIFLDFGISFSKQGKFYSDFLQPRKGNALGDYFEFGLLPKLKGIYRKDYLKHMYMPSEERSVDGVLLTHSHLDHNGCLKFLRKDIPVHCSEESKLVMEALDATMTASEFLKMTPSFKFYVNKGGKKSRVDKRHGEIERKVKTFVYGKEFEVGDITVTPYQVDHSLPGASAFLIETPDETLVYTGDLRLHGRYPEWTEYFVEKASEYEPDIMICEGTRVDERTSKTEEWVEKTSAKIINDAKGLAIANYPPRDTSRILTFFKTASDCGRKLAVDFRQAYLLKVFGEKGFIPRLEDVVVYAQPKSWFLINRPNSPKRQIPLDYLKWEREFLDLENLVTTEEVRNHQGEYVLFCSNFELGNLIDLQPVEGSAFIRSVCEPFDEEMILDKERIDRWYDHFGITKKHRHQIHCSGHVCGPDLEGMIERISPKVLMPIHTEKPGVFVKLIGDKAMRVKLAKEGKRMEIK